jgi:N-acetylglucosamine-6-phosphate deacetylase
MNGFKNVKILMPSGISKGNLEIMDGKIKSFPNHHDFTGIEFNEEVFIVPGFIDEHIHGVNNKDAMDGTIESLVIMAKGLAKEGTTSFLPTTMTQSVENIKKALQNIKNYIDQENTEGAEVLGIHLEGPYLNKGACGAQPEGYIVDPTIEEFKEYQRISGNNIKLVTIAPEIKGGLELIKYCHDQGIVASLGHTLATYPEVLAAIKQGATSVTHCYNAMTGLHHREVGVVGATLLHDELNAELIADGIHVSEQAIKLLYKNKGKDNMTLVTDSLRAKGLEDGIYDLGGQNVTVKDNTARLSDGTLAGSTLFMNKAVKNIVEFLNIGLEDAVLMASTNPAKKLGVYDRKGSIELGKDADLVVLNKDYDVMMTVCKGHIVYQKGE